MTLSDRKSSSSTAKTLDVIIGATPSKQLLYYVTFTKEWHNYNFNTKSCTCLETV